MPRSNKITIALIFAVFCLLQFSNIDIATCLNSVTPTQISSSHLAAQSLFKPLVDDGIQYSTQLELEIVTGMRLLHSGRPPAAVNGFLIERFKKTGGERLIDFLPSIRRGKYKTVAKFKVAGHDNFIFQIRYESKRSVNNIRYSSGNATLKNVYKTGDSITISRVDDRDELLYPEFRRRTPEEFALRIRDIRNKYYSYLDELPANKDDAIHVIRYGKEFRRKMIDAINGLFNDLGVGKGLTLITAGSFAINEHVEGSDFDWYFVIDETPENIQMIKRILEIFKKANIKLDENIVPRYDPREDQSINGEWENRFEDKPRWVSIKGIDEFFNLNPFFMVGKITGTLNIMYLGGDKDLYNEIEAIYEQNIMKHKFQLGDGIIRDMESIMQGELTPSKFDVKYGKGMLFNINCTLWLLQIMNDDFNLALEENTPFIMLNNYCDQGYISEDEKGQLLEAMCLYLLLRNAIVGESEKYYKLPSGYETKYFDDIAEGVAGRLGFNSRKELEELVTRHSDKVVRVYKKISKKLKSAKLDHVNFPEKAIAMADEMRLSKENSDERYLAQKVFPCLKIQPINMRIGLSIIPYDRLKPEVAQKELEENMETIARLMALHKAYHLNIRYVFEGGPDISYKEKAVSILKSKIKALAAIPGINADELLSSLEAPHTGDDVIDIMLRDVSIVKNISALRDNEYVVALENENTDDTIFSIPNYTAASSIGLSLAALHVIKREANGSYVELRNVVLNKLRSIYIRYAVIIEDGELTAEQLDLMVSGYSRTKLYYAVLYALPPAVKISVERLLEHHKYIQRLLQAA